MTQRIKSALWWLLVEFISLLPPNRLRYPTWNALESITPGLRPRRRLLKHSRGLIDRDIDEEALSFQMMDSDGRYLLVQSISPGFTGFVFSGAKVFFLAFGVAGCIYMLVTGDRGGIATEFYGGSLVVGGAIAFGMRVLGVTTIDPVAVFDRYTGHVYFPGGFLRRALTCKFEDVEVVGTISGIGSGSASFIARPTLRRPWSLTPKVDVIMYIGDRDQPAKMWQTIERFMNTPLGHLLPFAPGSSDRILAYHKLGLTVPDVHPPGLSEFNDDSLSYEPWWKAAGIALAKRGQELPADDYRDWADFEMDDVYAFVEHEARTHGVLTEWAQRDKDWREKRERRQREWDRENQARRARLRALGVRLSDEQQPDTGN